MLKGNVPLPYSVEYAKSSRSTCKKCRKTIDEGTLRMSVCQAASFFDGNIDSWFHFECFWYQLNKNRDVINISSIRGVDWLRWEDQEKLRGKIQMFRSSMLTTQTTNYSNENTLNLPDLKVDYSLTNRGKCGLCVTNFDRGELKMYYKSKWVHAKCLFPKYDKILGDLDQIQGWMSFEEQWQKSVVEAYENIPTEKREKKKAEPVATVEQPEVTLDSIVLSPSRKRSNDDVIIEEVEEENGEDSQAKKRRLNKEAKKAEIRKRRMKDQADKLWGYRQLFEKMSTHELRMIMKENDQDIPEGHDPTAQLIERIVDNALFGCPIGCSQCKNGKIVYNSARRTYVCTGYATEYSRCTFESENPVRTPFRCPINIMRSHQLDNTVFNEMSARLYLAEEKEDVLASGKRNRYTNEVIYAAEAFDSMNRVPTKLADVTASNTHIIKNGTLVDAKFPYASRCHVYKDEKDGFLYQATLSFTDLTLNKNSFYKIQLLKDDRIEQYYLFRSWGRVGTDVGDTKTESFERETAIYRFQEAFQEKTKNEWKYRKHFRKMPGCFNYVETDFSEIEQLGEEDVLPGSKTLLPKPVKEIVMSIFDVENMKSALKSFEMDVNKMPLGRLSRNQINQAFVVLTELGELLSSFPVDTMKVFDATNKFYTLIPHNFGMRVPDAIDSFHKIKEKNNMLNALLDIKFAYDQICGGDKPAGGLIGVDPVDTNYQKLKCTMTPLEPGCKDWNDIHEYMKNTQGSTHDMNVELIDIVKVDRVGEMEKFQRHLGNRKLLWHGSGKMNFAGILGQGLRIAPPEAPVSGYMFGKGVYFADMFSKSFFYCRANNPRDEAYLLLCDVALGEMNQLYQATTVSKKTLPRGMSSVKGIGREFPDTAGEYQHPDGYMIPKGKGQIHQHNPSTPHTLQYNEYIVYDVDQIQLKYLVRVKINHARYR